MRMPRDMRQRLYQMTQEQERFEREHLRTPTAVELSERMGIAPEEFLALLALRTQNEAVSLDTPVGEEGDTQLSDLLGRCRGWNGARLAACGPWRPRHNEAWNVKGGWRVCNRTPINRRILIRRDRPAP